MNFRTIVNEVTHAAGLLAGVGMAVFGLWQHQTGGSADLTLVSIGGTLTVMSLHAYKWGPAVIGALQGIRKEIPAAQALNQLLPGSVQGIAAIGEEGLGAVIDAVLAAQAAGGGTPTPTAVALAMAKAAAKPAAPGGA